MKRFHWRLQQFYNVTSHREEALRSELLALSHEAGSLRKEIQRRQAIIRSLLAELTALGIQERLVRQEIFLQHSVREERQIKALKDRLEAVARQRTAKTEQLMKIRAQRKSLDKLREAAIRQHLLAEQKVEQKQFDERAHMAFGRNAAARQTRSMA